MLTQPDATVSSIARLLNVSRSTIYKYVPELATGRPAAERPTVRAELEAGHRFPRSAPTRRLVAHWLTAPRLGGPAIGQDRRP
ncbi:helix-turn-helix domain-containing protein [Streptosporangium sp. NPDC020072]|uniref:helix-turn-helix domain-containing protein n=1 Tax=Streptosporangium sp. NPDC020072 TaxID=3154788 RepID=UPI00344A58D7